MNFGFLLFPNVTQLDLTGPIQVLSRVPGAKTHVAAKDMAPVMTDVGFAICPNVTFTECPPLDLLCVPGGFGVDAAMADGDTMAFVAAQAVQARYVTSVCTGAFILGAAGLLQGRRATTHWAYHALLTEVGAIPTPGRVVRDGNIFTGGGVTAGIDFALTIAAEIAGAEAAQRIQLQIEYDPAPPFQAGSPTTAEAAIVDSVSGAYAQRLPAFAAALRAATQKRA
jgi:cyclohexyl-isocyanide hydratase